MTQLSDSLKLIGGLSRPSKMPCYSYSLPAKNCLVGSQLAQLPGSVCHDCYALKGAYRWPVVDSAMQRRLATVRRLETDGAFMQEWIAAFAYVLNYRAVRNDRGKNDSEYFRWFDSGDLQSVRMLHAIVHVADATPAVKHWLPTKERAIITAWLLEHTAFPSNLTVRVSAAMLDQAGPVGVTGFASEVHDQEQPNLSIICPAPTNNGECGSCRRCWHEPVVSYHKH